MIRSVITTVPGICDEERVQFAEREYKGKRYIDIRVYFKSGDNNDEWIPSKKGITLSVEEFTPLAAAICQWLHTQAVISAKKR